MGASGGKLKTEILLTIIILLLNLFYMHMPNDNKIHVVLDEKRLKQFPEGWSALYRRVDRFVDRENNP
jgi:hypothetical protein